MVHQAGSKWTVALSVKPMKTGKKIVRYQESRQQRKVCSDGGGYSAGEMASIWVNYPQKVVTNENIHVKIKYGEAVVPGAVPSSKPSSRIRVNIQCHKAAIDWEVANVVPTLEGCFGAPVGIRVVGHDGFMHMKSCTRKHVVKGA